MLVDENTFHSSGPGPGITVHLPPEHPQCPAPQSIGPSQTAVHSSLQGSLNW